MLTTFINSFILFFVTIDTIGNLPFFLSLTEDTKIKKINVKPNDAVEVDQVLIEFDE